MPRLMPALVLCCLLLAPACLAADPDYVPLEQRLTPEQRRETGLDTLSPAQLARLNALLREQAAAEAAARPAPAPAAPMPAFVGLDDAPVSARVVGTVAGWDVGTEFVLDNGQVWKVLKGSLRLRTPLDSPEVEVSPGIAGRWFIQVTEDAPKARVYRIK